MKLLSMGLSTANCLLMVRKNEKEVVGIEHELGIVKEELSEMVGWSRCN